MKTGIELIAEERQRQIEKEGYTTNHDDKYLESDLACAAACYALPEDLRNAFNATGIEGDGIWPWNLEYWKPTPDDRIKELVKAGALIAAEIDRIKRL